MPFSGHIQTASGSCPSARVQKTAERGTSLLRTVSLIPSMHHSEKSPVCRPRRKTGRQSPAADARGDGPRLDDMRATVRKGSTGDETAFADLAAYRLPKLQDWSFSHDRWPTCVTTISYGWAFLPVGYEFGVRKGPSSWSTDSLARRLAYKGRLGT